MNSNEITPKISPRLKRIRYMSQLLKGLIIFYLVMPGLFYTLGIPHLTLTSQGKERLYQALTISLALLAAIAVYRLLSLYEKGVIFAEANTLGIRQLGYLAVACALLKACAPAFLPNEGIFYVPTVLLNVLLSPWFFAGLFAVVITWIMDEGRRIEEEQRLTV
jgi:hypothetical protein